MGEHKEQPPDLPQLPFLEIGDWILKHPWSSYYKRVTDGEIMTKTGITMGLEVAAHVVEALEPIAWIHLGWEILTAGSEEEERRQEAAEALREAWNAYMWEKYWNSSEVTSESRDAREAAFDRLVGDNANHGMVPELTKEAELKRQELINQINDHWLKNAQAINTLKRYVETGEGAMEIRSGTAQYGTFDGDYYLPVTPLEPVHRWYDPNAEAAKKYVIADDAKHELELYKAATTADLKKVTDFDTNPANWALKPEQKALVPNFTCEMPTAETKSCEGSPAETDNADKIYDIVGGRPN
jgi:hypothetical protein